MRNVTLRLLGTLLVAAVACGESAVPRPGSSDPGGSAASYDGTWRLVEGRGPEGEVPIVQGYRITLSIEGRNINGTAACNGYGGEASIDGSSFSLGSVSITEMACRPDVMDSEAAYTAALPTVDEIARDGDTLTLTGKNTELRFEIVPPIPTADLVDTQWELESLIYGAGNDGVVGSAAPARLLLKSDGTIRGTTGCRDLYGEWIEDGDEIAFTTFGARGNCPEELREQDGHVVTVLGDGFTPEIEGDRLTIVDRGGLGLEYRAST